MSKSILAMSIRCGNAESSSSWLVTANLELTYVQSYKDTCCEIADVTMDTGVRRHNSHTLTLVRFVTFVEARVGLTWIR